MTTLFDLGFQHLHRKIITKIPRVRHLSSSFLHLNGVTFETPKIMGTMCWTKDDWMIDLLNRIANGFEGIFLDIGVNIGQTLLAIKSVDPEREYVGIEPNSSCVAYVEELITQNGLRRIRLVPVGIGREVCLKELYMSGGEYDSCATFIPNFRSGQPTSKAKIVPVFPFSMLRSLFDGDRIGIAKIDVEGAEFEVLESMQDVVDEMRPLVFIEILPVYDAHNSQRLDRQILLEALVESIDYSIFRILKGKDDRLKGLARVDRIGVHSNLQWCDYVLVCRSKEKDLESCGTLLA